MKKFFLWLILSLVWLFGLKTQALANCTGNFWCDSCIVDYYCSSAPNDTKLCADVGNLEGKDCDQDASGAYQGTCIKQTICDGTPYPVSCGGLNQTSCSGSYRGCLGANDTIISDGCKWSTAGPVCGDGICKGPEPLGSAMP